MTYSEVQQQLLAEFPNGYKLDGYIHDHNLSLKNFIHLFINTLRSSYRTITNNPVKNHLVCTTDKRRTIGDIFLISLHYYPNSTIEEVWDVLCELHKEESFYSHFCTCINKYVFTSYQRRETRLYSHHEFVPNEYGWVIGQKYE